MHHIIVETLPETILGGNEIYILDNRNIFDKDVLRVQKEIIEHQDPNISRENKWLQILKSNINTSKNSF